jgi:glutaredoxin 2
MITLYINPTCPYCIKTMKVAHDLHIPLDLRDIHTPELLEELVRLEGKKQFPFMVDTERGVSMYESDDIMHYFRTQYGT